MTEKIKSIIVLEAGGIGDTVMATPALSALRHRFPHARIAVVVVRRAAELIEPLDLDFEIRLLRLGSPFWLPVDAARLVAAARLAKPDLLIDLSSIESSGAARRRRLLAALIGARRSLGRNTGGRGAFFDDAMDESLFGEEHEVERKLAVLAPLGIRVGRPSPSLRIPRPAFESARLLLEEAGICDTDEMVGINPGAFLATRRWPVERFERLAAELTENGRRALLVTGGEQERGLVARVANKAGGRAVRAAGRPLLELAALIAKCRLFVTNDTGAMHIAAARDVPVVAIFGHTNARRYRPYLPPKRCTLLQQPAGVCDQPDADAEAAECRRPECPSGECMRSISFQSVRDAAMKLLVPA